MFRPPLPTLRCSFLAGFVAFRAATLAASFSAAATLALFWDLDCQVPGSSAASRRPSSVGTVVALPGSRTMNGCDSEAPLE